MIPQSGRTSVATANCAVSGYYDHRTAAVRQDDAGTELL